MNNNQEKTTQSNSNNTLSNQKVALFIYNAFHQFGFALFIMILTALIWALDLSLRPYLLKLIIDRISDTSNHDIFNSVGSLVIIYFLMTFIYASTGRFYGYFVEIKMIPTMRRNIANISFTSLLKQSYSYYQNNFAGSLTNKVNDLTSSVPDIIQLAIDRFFSHGIALFIAIITLWQVNAVFALGMFCWSVIFIGGSLFLSKKLSHLADNWSESASTITGTMVDSLSNILAIRLFAQEKEEKAYLSCVFDNAVNAEKKLQWAYFWVWFFYGYSFVIVQGVNLYFLLVGRQEGWITVGDFVVVLSINFAIVDCLWQITKDFSQCSKLWGKVTQSLRAIQVIPEIQDSSDATTLHITHGRIIFDNVKFHYKGAEALFEHKSVTIEPGEKVGLVGYSGGGKSTFVNLILRLYDVTEGRILIDGQDIREVTQNSLHTAIGMIPQEPFLFNRSIMENIRYGRINATDSEVLEAAKKAHAHEFITELPQGYHAMVGERGAKLSGGQRQRIAIARAMLKNAPLLILDEATSQLDTITERKIQESLWQLMQGKTTLVVAHRLSTLLHMDRILVFDQGEIVEDATHYELLTLNGLYKSLWDAQVDGFLPDNKNEINS
ncbi:MAG: ABC transporter ATP-binding protein [Candidatus Dependentiae bacterium]|nr:ABC transporter ATP-binding protein [Candidatus Dependentiae bacterium]